jgi:hypothetical protein
MTLTIVNKRNISKSKKSFFLNVFPPFFFIFLTLCALPLYTPWIFNKDIEAKKDWTPNPFNFVIFHKQRILDENITSFKNVIFAKEPKEDISIPTEKIWIENGGFEKMNHELLLFNLALGKYKPRVKGIFKKPSSNDQLEARINIRGTRATHHMVWKPSVKVRLKKKKTYEGFRDQIFIGPEDVMGVKNWLSAQLGNKWNLLNNLEGFVRLYINNKNFGLYNKVSPFNESFLIKFGRLPGPIFNFNIFNKQLLYVWKKMWYEPGAWKSTEKKYIKDLHLIDAPVNTSKEIIDWQPDSEYSVINKINNLNHYISQEQFAKYLAVLAHGGEQHYVNNHNALFWVNPSSGLMEPIINDQNGYGLSNKKKWIQDPIIKNEGAFIQAWFKNPLNQASFIDKLNKLVNSIGNEKNISQLIDNQSDKIKSILQSETSLSYSCVPARCFFPIDKLDEEIDNLKNNIELRLNWIRKELNRDQAILINQDEKGFEIMTLGYSGIKAQRKDKKTFSFSNLQHHSFYKNKLIQIGNVKKAIFLPAQSLIEKDAEEVSFNNSYSFFYLSGKPSDYVFSHRLSEKEIKISATKLPYDLVKMKVLEGISYLSLLDKNISPVILGPGKIRLMESKTFDPGQPVIIKAGTEIYLDKKIQIIVQGPLIIEGAEQKPVVIKPTNPKEPFGVLALLGNKTRGSKVNFLNMEGGSVGKFYNLNFSGMFSVHDCPDIEIRNSNFGKNYVGDDAVHIINSTATIIDSTFINSKMDALDLDLVNGKLSNNQFINPGNDGLDLSMGNTTIDKNRFTKCKDKCVSIGEGAKAEINNSYFQNCNVAIAIKDKSRATLKNSIIDSCNIGWNSYRKKWRWELGGEGEIINSKFINSRSADIAGDKLSKVNLIKQDLANLKINGKILVTPHPN